MATSTLRWEAGLKVSWSRQTALAGTAWHCTARLRDRRQLAIHHYDSVGLAMCQTRNRSPQPQLQSARMRCTETGAKSSIRSGPRPVLFTSQITLGGSWRGCVRVQMYELPPYPFLFLFRFLPHVHGPPSAQNTLLSHMLSNVVRHLDVHITAIIARSTTRNRSARRSHDSHLPRLYLTFVRRRKEHLGFNPSISRLRP
jgi:hypothetical protein